MHQREPALPIVVLSARARPQEKATGQDLGAVDYVTKPFDMNELAARLSAAARRSSRDSAGALVSMGDRAIDLANRVARNANGSSVHTRHRRNGASSTCYCTTQAG